ncbi:MULTISPECIES: molybdopterin synthase catalytic subunit MoaE [Pseudomonas]|uniref:molybdopterin synthase catalytic subunit MoaE n=1 Tax=Pseudomonas TaxID=286 RepID=UPI000C87E072|nr:MULTISPECIES: molybdopterin synthase catalytic subunit MoaE [Pseudomonas]AVO59871.1 molybdopterin synthase catalytic subunit MoaE [Pseudomonas chlororaphis subsp. piscium]PMY37021.1 molybdopterin synthase catalytic subunit MoaE [Pseudomonas sp. FW306-2-2C-D06C]PYC39430.1 molybdopterin synthase catalytic subunit MoaE [Pseudomonas chlororaphis]
MTVHVQAEAFDLDRLHREVHGEDPGVGAVVTFVGYVRDLNLGEQVGSLFLEYYPGMTERALQRIVDEANERWPLQRVRVVHRVGLLQVAEPIVFVGVASAHRQAAFEACAFLMDYLKTRAPFWKREQTPSGERWVDGRESDQLAASRW